MGTAQTSPCPPHFTDSHSHTGSHLGGSGAVRILLGALLRPFPPGTPARVRCPRPGLGSTPLTPQSCRGFRAPPESPRGPGAAPRALPAEHGGAASQSPARPHGRPRRRPRHVRPAAAEDARPERGERSGPRGDGTGPGRGLPSISRSAFLLPVSLLPGPGLNPALPPLQALNPPPGRRAPPGAGPRSQRFG